MTGFREHSLRQQVVGEMHLRRFPPFTVPAETIQFIRLIDPDERASEAVALDSAPGMVVSSNRNRELNWSESIRAAWERHSEASTVTLSVSLDDAHQHDWDIPATGDAAAAISWAETLPGAVVRAARLLVVLNDAAAADAVEKAGFHPSHLVSCHIAGGARLWTDFRIHADGYGRHVVAANGTPIEDLVRAVQRLHELSNYRNLALLGLPTAQKAWKELVRIENALTASGTRLRSRDYSDDDLLAELIQYAEDLLLLAAACDSRMTATRAYAQIVGDRLEDLRATRIPGFQSLDDFTERRFRPAIRTCAALTDKIALLNTRAAQLTELLRTRVETKIANQNGRLLASLDRSARLQLRLQHLVEGLSAVAISYYMIGIVAYPLKASEKWIPELPVAALLGFLAPIIVALAFILLSRKRHQLLAALDRDVNEN